jgi:hypothetical protein
VAQTAQNFEEEERKHPAP